VVADPGRFYEDTNLANNSASRQVDILKAADSEPPTGTLMINDGATTTAGANVTLDLNATDQPGGSGVQWMYIAEFGLDSSTHHWKVVNDLGWIGYQAMQAWTLHGSGGVKYLAAWFADNAGNVSAAPALGMINYVPTDQSITAGEWHVYRWQLAAGATVNVSLKAKNGDADLYAWQPGNLGAPDWFSANNGTTDDLVSFAAPVAGVYQVQVYGQQNSTYTLALTTSGPLSGKESLRSGLWKLSAKSVPEHPFCTTVPPMDMLTPTLRGFVNYIQLLLKMQIGR
jgi:hypothetical protein